MLIEFRTKNYKSFLNEMTFSMLATSKQSGLEFSLLKEKFKRRTIKGLSSSVVYGLNAAGKTNVISAMDVFRNIVLKGNIRNSKERTSFNPASEALELIPNNNLDISQPIEFFVDFLEKKHRIQYNICIDLGKFLDDKYPRKIVFEELNIDGDIIFSRYNKLSFGNGNLKSIEKYLSAAGRQRVESAIEIANDSLNQEELFLTNGFKLIFSQDFVKLIFGWFSEKFMVIYRANSMRLANLFAYPYKNFLYIANTINEVAKLLGINSNAIGYISKDNDSDAKLYSIFKDTNIATAVEAEVFESYGTIRFINMFPLIVHTIQIGGTLVIDEFDASIHPMAIMSILNIFHNDEINIHHAQLIFNTHNSIFLNPNIFRKDEIKFVERDDESHNSILYSLSDFETPQKKKTYKYENYMENYFSSQYGAIRNIDFVPIFKEILKLEGEI